MRQQWSPDQFWQFVEGYAGEFEAGQLRETMAYFGLQIVPASPAPAARLLDGIEHNGFPGVSR